MGSLGSGATDVEADEDKLAAARCLEEHVLRLYASSAVSAKDVAILCHYCIESGVENENLRRWAMPPGKQSGACKRRTRAVLPSAESTHEFCHLGLPIFNKHSRGVRNVPLVPVHE
eukprot:3315393-Pyramimonas_sp.AAC.1